MTAVNVLGILTIFFSLFFLSWTGWLVALIMYFLVNAVGAGATFHRYYSHKSFEFRNETLRIVCTLLGAVSGHGSPAQWAAVHVYHHKSTDTEDDPHGPRHTFWRTFIIQEYYPFHTKTMLRMVKDPFHKFLYEYSMLILVLWWVFLYLIGDVWLLVSAGIIPTGLNLVLTNGCNWFCHMRGYRNFDTIGKDTNNWLFGIISFGEGWHNNHHAKPKSYTYQHHWWEIDVTALVIKYVLSK